MTQFERARIRLEAFKLFEGWGVAGDPKAESFSDRLPTPWGIDERMRRAEALAEWAMSPPHQPEEDR